MKNNVLFLAGLMIIFSACKKMEDAPVDKTDERLNETLTAYQSQLTQAQFGWKGYLLTNNKTAATFLFNFTGINRITMSADYATAPNESSYRLKALQRPTLLFDTYSSLHLLADPTPSKFKGTIGKGYYSDFEFAFVSASTDTIKLEGTFNKSKLILVRLTSDLEKTTTFDDVQAMETKLSKLRTYFKQTTIDGINCEVNVDGNKKIITFNYIDKTGELKSVSSSYFVSGTSMVFFETVSIGAKTISGLTSVVFDTANGAITASTNDGSPIQIKEAIVPLRYDATAAARFLTNPPQGNYCESYTGFTVDGKIDAYGVKTIPGFFSIDYYPKISGQVYGAVRFWLGLSYGAFGPALIPTIANNGTLSYAIAGSYGNAPVAIRPIITNTTENFIKKNGFYVIQTGNKTYDMVAVEDARSWITFQ